MVLMIVQDLQCCRDEEHSNSKDFFFFFATELTPTSTEGRSQQGYKCILIVLTGNISTPSTTASFLVFVEKNVLLRSHLNSIRREGWRCTESEWEDKIQRKHTAARSLERSQGS